MEIKIAQKTDIDTLIKIRLEMLRVVNALPADYNFSEDFISTHRKYFFRGDQTSVPAINESGEAVGCASISWQIWL